MRVETEVDHQMGGQVRFQSADWVIAELAADQHGVVARRQLLARGVSGRQIDRRLQHRRLHAIHRGVYAVGHRDTSRDGRWLAAVLAASPGAVLSHRSAGALWGILPATPARHEMTVPQSRPSRPGLRFHHSVLASDEITVERGIPVTTVARTLLDIAADMTLARLERGAAEAELRGLGSAVSLETLVARHPHKRGVVAIRALLNSGRIGIAVTRSELEDRFLARVRRAGLPEPRVNAIVGVGPQHIEVDFLWPSAKLAVELDGHATHSTRAAFERDRERDRLLAVAGWRTVRVTWRQLHDDPALVARDLRALLA